MAKTTVALKKKSVKKEMAPIKKKEVAKSSKQPLAKGKNEKVSEAKSKFAKSVAKKPLVKTKTAKKKAISKTVGTVKKSQAVKTKNEVAAKSSLKSKKIVAKKSAPAVKKAVLKAPISNKLKAKPAEKKGLKPITPKATKAIKEVKIKASKTTIEVPAPIVVKQIPDKKPRIKNVLISQAYPENGKSPFIDIGVKWKLKVDFRSFIQVEGLTAKEFRRLIINVPDYTAIIFNSRNAIHYFFKLCEEMRVKLSPDMKYFCTSEAIALYLQKYIHYRKRKVFYEYANKTLFEILNKHKDNEKFLYPCSKDRKDDIPNFLSSKKFNYSEAFIYQTVPSDLSDLKSIKYDVIIFFSPVGIKSLMYNYPDFKQEDRRIGAFGQVTHDAVKATFRLDIVAPSPVAHSMAQALENYLKESNGKA